MNIKIYEPGIIVQFKLWHLKRFGCKASMEDSADKELFEAWSAGYDAGYRAPDLAPQQPTTQEKV